MTDNLRVKEQFNKQAVYFNDWSVTQDNKIHQALYNFFGLEPTEHLLDIACGTGTFSIYAALKTKAVQGADISEKMIEIALNNAQKHNLENAKFLCCDVEKLPFESNHYDCVVSKAAFHHMKNYQAVFQEMVRCCKNQGRICIHDVILYDEAQLDDFFEALEWEIDISHYKALSKQEIINLYKEKGIQILRLFESITELDFNAYLKHAVQSPQAVNKINELVNTGLKEEKISRWLIRKNNKIFWKRKVLTIVGQKIRRVGEKMEQGTNKERIKQFMKEEFLIEFNNNLTEDDDLFKSGVIDSYGYIKLIRFLEEEFRIKFSEEEILSNVFVNFSSILECITEKVKAGEIL